MSSKPKRKLPALGQDNASHRGHPKQRRGVAVDLTVELDEAEDDALAQELVDNTQSTHDDSLEHTSPYVFLPLKVVGCRFYQGIATPGEPVILHREPTNRYDRNAISVSNVHGAQIGHVPRDLAAKLAPLVDRGIVWLEGVVAGQKAYYDMPIKVALMCSTRELEREAARKAIDAMFPRAERAVPGRREELRMEEVRKATQAATQRPASEYVGGGNSLSRTIPPQTWDRLVDQSQAISQRELGELVHKFGMGEDELQKMAKALQPARLITLLLPYQLQGLAWLLQQENPELPTAEKMVKLWKHVGPNRYMNVATRYTVQEVPDLASGGVLADDMGLGKTLQIIALIVSAVKAEKHLKPNMKRPVQCIGATLIIAPVSVMSNWSGQIEQHVSADRPLKVLVYHGVGRHGVKLEDYDVVVTSYGTLVSDFGPGSKNELFSVTWRRVVLDEAHIIRNHKSKASIAAHNLKAASRWALTGTPIVNNLKDLWSLLRFLRISGGLDNFQVFNSTLIRPLNNAEPQAQQLLQVLIGTLCLRRVKNMEFIQLGLPEMTVLVRKVQFRPEEKKKYELLEMEAKGLLHQAREGGVDQYRFLLEILLRMRQMCNHEALCGSRIESLLKLAGVERVDLDEENIKALQDLLGMAVEAQEECSVCLEPLHNPRITLCKHIFGFECIEKVITLQHKCPMCRATLDSAASSLVELPVATSHANTPTPSFERGASSKIAALLEILTASRTKDPTTKTVIFSQWTSFLDLLMPFLTTAGFNFVRIDGGMPPAKRDAAIARFAKEEECTILLASLSIASVGLNLVMASQVVLADSWWAPAIEDQAVDRVYRLGQKREVTVWRLVVEGGIEERVLDVQKGKRRLVAAAFREGQGGRKGRRTQEERLREVRVLLGAGDGSADA